MGFRRALISAACTLTLIGCDDSGSVVDAALPDTGPVPDVAADMAIDPADAGPDAAPVVDAAPIVDAAPDGAADAAVDAQVDLGPFCNSGYGGASAVGNLEGDTLVEASGLAASRTRDNVLWTHTDSGGESWLYAIDTAGNLRGQVEVPVVNTDWEDLAAAPCPNGSGPCLWIADVGDNFRVRGDVAVYAVPEPVVVAGEVERVWRYPVTYPGGPVDVEALAVAPDGSTFWLFEKVDAPQARVFQHPGPLTDGMRTELEVVATIDAPGIAVANGRSITGADMHPTGERLVVRVYSGSFEYVLGPDRTMADLAEITADTIALGPLSEPQGEAIAYDISGRAVWTVSEDPMMVGGQPLHRYSCRD